jgi:hypothetical protein
VSEAQGGVKGTLEFRLFVFYDPCVANMSDIEQTFMLEQAVEGVMNGTIPIDQDQLIDLAAHYAQVDIPRCWHGVFANPVLYHRLSE